MAFNHRAPGCKPKDLIGIPWLVALAAFLSAYASGEIALPQPDADYTDEQEETEDEA